MYPQTILVIDDNLFLLRLIRDILDKQGYITFTAQTGKAGLEIALSQTPDLIILDRKLGDIHGLDILEKVKSNSRLCSTPVIILSSENREAEIMKSLSLGANDYMVKPFQSNTLMRKAKRLLSQPMQNPVPNTRREERYYYV